MPRIDVIVHRYQPFDPGVYFLALIAEVWRDRGVEVRVIAEPASADGRADLAILHVDLTVVPGQHLAAARRYRRAINGRVADISKRAVSRNLVTPGDGFTGPVFVKTNLNAGGSQERALGRHGPWPVRMKRRISRALARLITPAAHEQGYTVYSSPVEVPPRIWTDPRLVVERFLPERNDQYFCLRTWVFLGDRQTHSASYSTEPVVKISNVVRRQTLDEPPADLAARRAELGFDYGKFDFVVRDGRPVLLDANPTPTLRASATADLLASTLADGIRAFL